MTKQIHESGHAYYGHGQVVCYTCGGARGKVIESVDRGFMVDSLEQAEISWLLEQANEHTRGKNASHIVRVYTYERAEIGPGDGS